MPACFHVSSLVVSLAFPRVRWAPGESLIAALEAAGGAAAQEAQIRQATSGSPSVLILKSLCQAVLAGGIITVIPALGEAAGWRGLLLKELSPLGFWASSFISG